LTGRFLAGGEVPAREKRLASILEVRGTHSSPKLGGWLTGGGIQRRTGSDKAAIGRLGR